MTTITDLAIESIEISDINACDLRKIADTNQSLAAYSITPIGEDGMRQSVTAQMLWDEDNGRAGIAWGADASWTDASSPQDAAERYFGIDGKAMDN